MDIWTYNWIFKTWSGSSGRSGIQDWSLNYFELCLPKPLSLCIPIICTHRHLLTSASYHILSPNIITHGRSSLCDKTMTHWLLNILLQTFCAHWWSKQAKTIHVSLSINSKDMRLLYWVPSLRIFSVCSKGPSFSCVFSLTVNSRVWIENKSH